MPPVVSRGQFCSLLSRWAGLWYPSTSRAHWFNWVVCSLGRMKQKNHLFGTLQRGYEQGQPPVLSLVPVALGVIVISEKNSNKICISHSQCCKPLRREFGYRVSPKHLSHKGDVLSKAKPGRQRGKTNSLFESCHQPGAPSWGRGAAILPLRGARRPSLRSLLRL